MLLLIHCDLCFLSCHDACAIIQVDWNALWAMLGCEFRRWRLHLSDMFEGAFEMGRPWSHSCDTFNLQSSQAETPVSLVCCQYYFHYQGTIKERVPELKHCLCVLDQRVVSLEGHHQQSCGLCNHYRLCSEMQWSGQWRRKVLLLLPGNFDNT